MQRLLALPERPDAVFCINDPVAIGAFLCLREQGVAIPGEVALIGFSNNPNTALVTPRLTTVNQPAFDIGRQAASLLLQHFSGEQAVTPQTIVLKTELIIREST
jgi:LacI family transcriptional regulator